MPLSTRMLRRRMKSVTNTRKMTKAMELVSGAKMRKTVASALASRNYAVEIRALVDSIRSQIDATSHPLFVGRSRSRSSLFAVIASDRGLCGGFNAQLVKKTIEAVSARTEEARIVTIGRRAELAVKRSGFPLFASFEAISNAPSYERALPIGELLSQEFLAKRADRVFVIFMHFKSAIMQVATIQQVLPIIPEKELVSHRALSLMEEEALQSEDRNILFEPDVEPVLKALLPRLVETQLYQAFLESAASEHSARMFAMRSATDNASEMLQDLSFTYNQARQATITREISEISAGKAVIE